MALATMGMVGAMGEFSEGRGAFLPLHLGHGGLTARKREGLLSKVPRRRNHHGGPRRADEGEWVLRDMKGNLGGRVHEVHLLSSKLPCHSRLRAMPRASCLLPFQAALSMR